MERVFLYGAVTAQLGGTTARLSGFALPDDPGCFPLAAMREGGEIEGVYVAAHPVWETLFHALGAMPVALSDTAIIYVGDDLGGTWDSAAWRNRWQGIAPNALREALERAPDMSPEELKARMPMILSRAAAQDAASHPKPALVRSDRGRDLIEVEREAVTHAGFFLTRSYELRHPRFDGSMSAQVPREVFVATDAVIVLPYDPRRDRVLLVEQFRMGPYGRGDARPWMLEPVAGRVDAGETPEDTARRECVEEAGLTLHGLEHIASHYCSPGCSTEYFHCYLGLTDLPDLVQGQGGLDTEHEDIRTHVLDFAAAEALLTSGEADNGPLILMLFWLQANRSRLRACA